MNKFLVTAMMTSSMCAMATFGYAETNSQDAKARAEMKTQDTTSAAYEMDVKVDADADLKETVAPSAQDGRPDTVENKTTDTHSGMLNQDTENANYDVKVKVDVDADTQRVAEDSDNPHPVPATNKQHISDLPNKGTATLTGVVEKVEKDEITLRDKTGVIDVRVSDKEEDSLKKGDMVEITGTIDNGFFNKDLVAEQITKVKTM